MYWFLFILDLFFVICFPMNFNNNILINNQIIFNPLNIFIILFTHCILYIFVDSWFLWKFMYSILCICIYFINFSMTSKIAFLLLMVMLTAKHNLIGPSMCYYTLFYPLEKSILLLLIRSQAMSHQIISVPS